MEGEPKIFWLHEKTRTVKSKFENKKNFIETIFGRTEKIPFLEGEKPLATKSKFEEKN